MDGQRIIRKNTQYQILNLEQVYLIFLQTINAKWLYT